MPAFSLSPRTLVLPLAALSLALLAGCASSRPAVLLDNSQAQQIECHGLFGSWQACRSQALAVCGTGAYQVISRNQRDGASEAEAEALEQGAAFHQRSMLVQCAAAEQPLLGFNR